MKLILTLLLVIFMVQEAQAKKCTGQFVNPITDICWKCLFPISIGNIDVVRSEHHNPKNPSLPVCMCPKKVGAIMIPMPGIVGGFWEPSRLVDVSAEPYCFVNLGGLEIDMGFDRSQGGRPGASSSKISRWYVHYYAYPVLAILELFKEFVCLEGSTQFDVLWISELDPTGSDDDLSLILSPEAFLFNNLVAQAACSADCVSATTSKSTGSLDSLYWCAGCQGTMFPLNGNINAHIGGVQASVNATEKMMFRMHRQGLAQEGASDNVKEICEQRLAPIMKKSHYRYQMVNPDPDKCYPFGSSTTKFESRKEIPVIGEDFGYLIWKKRNCCIW